MKKFKDFFIKHKIKIFLSIALIVAACSITAVSIALWNKDEDEHFVYTPVVNPSEEYLEYYAVVENASSVDGFDYYPVNRVPQGLEVYGLAVARYTGFSSEVVIPETKYLTINGVSKDYIVTHVINNYTDTIDNGFHGISKVVLPKTIVYVEANALSGVTKVFVSGDIEYKYTLTLTEDTVIVKNSDGNKIDELVKYETTNYLSKTTLDLYPIIDGNISYISKSNQIKLNDEVNLRDGLYQDLSRVYGLDDSNTTYLSDLRKNSITYSLNSPDLFNRSTGYMISNGNNSYYRYIINTNTTNKVTIDSKVSDTLDKVGRYKVTYIDGVIGLEYISYSANETLLSLDTSFTDYERYLADVTLNNSNVVVGSLSTSNTYTGTYEVIYSPDTVFTDLENITRLSVNEIYYAHQIVSGSETDLVSFVLPNISGVTYYANIDNNSYKLEKKVDSIYQLAMENGQTGTLSITGMNLENEVVYLSHEFLYVEGNEYDLTATNTNLVLTVRKLDTKEYMFEVSLPSSFEGETVKVNLAATLYNVNEAQALSISKTVTNGKVVITTSDITNVLLKNAGIFSSEYIFNTYNISLYNGDTKIMDLYSYENDRPYQDSNDIDFYQKNYVLNYSPSVNTPSYYLYTSNRLERNYGVTTEVAYYLNDISESSTYVISNKNSISGISHTDLVVSNTSNSHLVFDKTNNKTYLGTNENNLTINSLGQYVGLDKVDTLTNGLEPGMYQVTYDGSNYHYYRIEGSKKYYISTSLEGVYTEMSLVETNVNFEEYKIENYSVSTTNIYIKDDLGLSYGPYSLNTGLYSSINFSLDNRRRAGNSYEVFTNIKTVAVENPNTVTLIGINEEEITYYLADTSLPEYSSLFELYPGYEFIGWYNGENKVERFANGGTYQAHFNKYLVVENENGYVVEITSDQNSDSKLNLGDKFKVIPTVGYSVNSVMIDEIELDSDSNDIYTVTEAMLTKVLDVDRTVNTYQISFNNGNGQTQNPEEYTFGTNYKFTVPSKDDATFGYYYDQKTGIVYTDNQGNLLSPYMITNDITLTAYYANSYSVVINSYINGEFSATERITNYTKGSMVSDYIPRIVGLTYTSVNPYQISDGNPVSFDMYEYEHRFSFVMPATNVVINVNYVYSMVDSVEASSELTTLYVLIPSSFGTNVAIFDATSGDYGAYKEMTRLPYEEQIYSGYLAYKVEEFDKANTQIKVRARDYESYVYETDYSHNLLVIDNFSLENEVATFTDWLDYTKVGNIYTINTEVDAINPIDGNISVTDNVVTITKAINTADEDYYQKASFEVVLSNEPFKISFVISYIADGSEENPVILYDQYDFYEYFNKSVTSYIGGLNFKQTNTITISDDDGYNIVFDQTNPFEHIYDGNGNTINYTQSSIRNDENNGLFGYIGANGIVKNIILNYDLLDTNSLDGQETKYYLGSIASVNIGTIENITTGVNYITAYNVRYVGGIVGYNYNTISGCTNNIGYGLYDYGVNYSNIVGGIAGYNRGTITSCYNYAKQSVSTKTNQTIYEGDLAALNGGSVSGTSYSSVINDMHITTDRTFYFTDNKNSLYGDVIYAYAWVNGTSISNNSFPGVEMEYVAMNGEERIYKVNVDKKYDSIIFSKYVAGEKVYQTVDINLLEDNKDLTQTQFWTTTDLVGDKTYDIGYGRDKAYFSQVYASHTSGYLLYKNGEVISNLYKTKTGKYQIAAFDLLINEGDYLEVKNNEHTLTGFKLDNENFSYIDGKIVCSKTDTYSIYANFTIEYNESLTNAKENQTQKLIGTINAVFVDDWWFIDHEMDTQNGVFHFEAGILVEYLDGSGKVINKLVYNEGQIYQYNNMNSIIVDLFEGTTSVNISRVMFIYNNSSGMDRFYYSYDEYYGFAKLSTVEYESFPDATYTVNVSGLTNGEAVFIYTTDSQVKYATAGPDSNGLDVGPVDFNKALAITTDLSIVAYVDVIGLEVYPSYRVKYLDESGNVIAIRSYLKGEQLQLLDGAITMTFEASYDGNGFQLIADEINANNITNDTLTFTFAPNSGTSNESSFTDGVVAVINDSNIIPLRTNPNNNNEVMTTALDLNKGDTIKLYNYVSGELSTQVLFTSNSGSNKVSYANNTYTLKEAALIDLYYDTVKKSVYVGDATVYEILLNDNSGGQSKLVNAIRMHVNPNNNNEVMATGIVAEAGYSFTFRKVGDDNPFATLVKNNYSKDIEVSGNTVTFTASNNYDIYIDKSSNTPSVYVGYSNNPLYTALWSTVGELPTSNPINPEGLPTFKFNSINGFSEGRVYYVGNSDELLGYYVFDGDTTEIPYVNNAVKLYIVKYSGSVVLNYIVVNAVYQTKTLSLTNPYYGYYDAKWTSRVDDRDYVYFEALATDKVYINYLLNDGRTGSLEMNNDNGTHKLIWGTVIGLNPVNISFTVLDNLGEEFTTTSVELKNVDIINSNCFYLDVDVLSSKAYRDYNEIHVYIDENSQIWNEYYLLIDGLHYEIEEVSDNHYVSYVPISNGDTFKITSNPSLDKVVETSSLTYTNGNNYYVVYSIGNVESGAESQHIYSGSDLEHINLPNDLDTIKSSINYDYYLSGSINGFTTSKEYGLGKEGSYYYLFLELSQDMEYYIVNSSGTSQTELKTIGSGSHMLVFNGSSVEVYSNYLTYKVEFVYGDKVYIENYRRGETLVFPQLTPTASNTTQYTFQFKSWTHNGIEVENNSVIVNSNMTLYPAFAATLNKYNVTFISKNNTGSSGSLSKTISVNYGERISNVIKTRHNEINHLETPIVLGKAWFLGWYLDDSFEVKAKEHIVRGDMNVYADWIYEGVYLIGVVEGCTDWANPVISTLGSYNNEPDGSGGNKDQQEILDVYLQAGDEVKLMQIVAKGDTFDKVWHPQTSGNWFYDNGNSDYNDDGISNDENNPTSGINAYYNSDNNLEIGKSGYYSFYLLWKEFNNDYDNQIYVTVKEYVAYFDRNVGNSSSITQQKFDMDSSWPLTNAPVVTNGSQVLFGWFNRRVGGERITSLTPSMMVDRNSYTLYAQYINPGYYVNGSDLSNLVTKIPQRIEVTNSSSLKLYHYNGSKYGSSDMTANEISGTRDGNWNVTPISSNDVNGNYNIISNITPGIYYVYLNDNDKLCIDQYHTVTYIMGKIGSVDATNMTYETEQLYNSNLKTFTPNNGFSKVKFLGWMEDPDNATEYVTIVNKNIVVYAIYRIGSVNESGHPHDYKVLKYNETQHWLVCTLCDAETLPVAHTMSSDYGYNDDEHWQECSDCGYKSELVAHNFTTPNSDAVYHWNECICGAKENLVNHDYSGAWSSDKDKHWHVCECGEIETAVSHTPSTEIYSDEKEHWHSCIVCGNDTVNVEEHTYEYRYDGANHWRECIYCGYTDEEVAHTTEGNYDQENHWLECECGYIENIEEHSYDNGVMSSTEKARVYSCSCGHTKNEKTVRIYFEVNWSWYNMKAYVWDVKSPTADFPGTGMTYITNNICYIDIELDDTHTQAWIIFVGDENYQQKQTVNIDIYKLGENNMYYFSGWDSNAGKGIVSSKQYIPQ